MFITFAAIFENLNLDASGHDGELFTKVMLKAILESVEKIDSQGIELIILSLALYAFQRFKARRITMPPQEAPPKVGE